MSKNFWKLFLKNTFQKRTNKYSSQPHSSRFGHPVKKHKKSKYWHKCTLIKRFMIAKILSIHESPQVLQNIENPSDPSPKKSTNPSPTQIVEVLWQKNVNSKFLWQNVNDWKMFTACFLILCCFYLKILMLV